MKITRSFLIELGEGHAKDGVHDAKHNRVGQNLDEVRRAGGERQEHTRGQKNEQQDGDDDIKIHLCIRHLKIFLCQTVHVDGETDGRTRLSRNPDE
jgi:hypothetical protein